MPLLLIVIKLPFQGRKKMASVKSGRMSRQADKHVTCMTCRVLSHDSPPDLCASSSFLWLATIDRPSKRISGVVDLDSWKQQGFLGGLTRKLCRFSSSNGSSARYHACLLPRTHPKRAVVKWHQSKVLGSRNPLADCPSN